MAKKSLLVTYVLWFFGGFLGLHHFYLGRDLQGLVWAMLAGGYFGLGWLRDLKRIPEYVRDANDDPAFIATLTESMRKNGRPPSSTVRLCGMMLLADTLGYLTLGAIPEDLVPEWTLPWLAAAVPLAVSIGVYVVGNIGRHEGNFRVSLLGAYLTYPLYFYSLNSVVWSSLVSSSLFNNYAKQWRRTPRARRHPCIRLAVVVACLSIYLCLAASWAYFNCQITQKSGDVVPCRDAVKNFFTSPLWQEFKSVVRDMWEFAKHNGWKEIWRQLLEALDPQGEANALKTLGLTSGASEEEIKLVYRKLSRQWHPDRFKDGAERDEAGDRFIEIQKAYETLSSIKSKRLLKNKAGRDNP